MLISMMVSELKSFHWLALLTIDQSLSATWEQVGQLLGNGFSTTSMRTVSFPILGIVNNLVLGSKKVVLIAVPLTSSVGNIIIYPVKTGNTSTIGIGNGPCWCFEFLRCFAFKKWCVFEEALVRAMYCQRIAWSENPCVRTKRRPCLCNENAYFCILSNNILISIYLHKDWKIAKINFRIRILNLLTAADF